MSHVKIFKPNQAHFIHYNIHKKPVNTPYAPYCRIHSRERHHGNILLYTPLYHIKAWYITIL